MSDLTDRLRARADRLHSWANRWNWRRWIEDGANDVWIGDRAAEAFHDANLALDLREAADRLDHDDDMQQERRWTP
jgi:hypothetical protein